MSFLSILNYTNMKLNFDSRSIMHFVISLHPVCVGVVNCIITKSGPNLKEQTCLSTIKMYL